MILLIEFMYLFREKKNYNLKKIQMDTLYNYFHKIQDSILAKNYPINMDSLKGAVFMERNSIGIYDKLKKLEDSVNAYK